MGPPLTAWQKASTKNLGGEKSGTPWSRCTTRWLCASCVISFLLVPRGGQFITWPSSSQNTRVERHNNSAEQNTQCVMETICILYFPSPPTVFQSTSPGCWFSWEWHHRSTSSRSLQSLTFRRKCIWTMCLLYDSLLIHYSFTLTAGYFYSKETNFRIWFSW